MNISRRTTLLNRRGRPLEVDDFDLSSTTIASSDPTSAANPVYQYTPILSLGSLLGSATAAEFSQLQGYKSVSIGKLKCHLTMMAHASPTTPAIGDYLRACWALLIAPSQDETGVPTTDMQQINPFLAGVVPGATEATKNPWDESMDKGHARYLWLKRHTYWLASCHDVGAGRLNYNRPSSMEVNFRLRKGYRLRETSTLYLCLWWYANFNNYAVNDVNLWEHCHIGVPRRFNA